MSYSPARTALLALSAAASLVATGCSEPLESTADSVAEPAGEVVDDAPIEAQQVTPTSPTAPAAPTAPAPAAPGASHCAVATITPELRAERKINSWYQKYASVDGVLILSSGKPPDKTVQMACEIVAHLTSKHPESRAALVKAKSNFAMIAATEKTTDPPEYRSLPDYYNTRARGLGGQLGLCAEESIMCDRTKDRWFGESICVHEYAHTISIYGFYAGIPGFHAKLTAAYKASRQKNLWASTYAAENEQEYWAEGVQSFYYTNLESARPNGVHGPINTREELQTYDPALYELVADTLPAEMNFPDCYRRK
ncbi:MAG: hypothetical protein ABW252_06810 [Polyangiales bacterium]